MNRSQKLLNIVSGQEAIDEVYIAEKLGLGKKESGLIYHMYKSLMGVFAKYGIMLPPRAHKALVISLGQALKNKPKSQPKVDSSGTSTIEKDVLGLLL